MEKYKYLIKNMGLLTLSNFATKILSFFLVPLYTTVLSTVDYGKYDFISSTVGILIPILTINIYEAVLRFAMDKDIDSKIVFSIGIELCLVGNFIVLSFLLTNHFITFSNIIEEYSLYFFLMFFVNSISGIMTSMARGTDKIRELSISSVMGSAISIFLNLLFLLILKIGLRGYFIANIIGVLIQNIYLLMMIKIKNDIIVNSDKLFVRKIMLRYSVPTIANAIAWWINGLSDRYVVIYFCGIAANGIYSVAAKIPSILNIFQNIFSQAFMLSAVREFDIDDKDGFFRKTFDSYNCLLVLLCSIIICFDKILARYLYAKDFYVAWKYVPFLTISIIFGALSGYAGSIFAALKKSEYFAKCSVVGAIANILMNIVLVPGIGPMGAAIATTISYWMTYLVSMYYLNKCINLKISIIRDNIAYLILMIQSFSLLLFSNSILLQYGMQLLALIIILLIYNKKVMCLINKRGKVK